MCTYHFMVFLNSSIWITRSTICCRIHIISRSIIPAILIQYQHINKGKLPSLFQCGYRIKLIPLCICSGYHRNIAIACSINRVKASRRSIFTVHIQLPSNRHIHPYQLQHKILAHLQELLSGAGCCRGSRRIVRTGCFIGRTVIPRIRSSICRRTLSIRILTLIS